MFDYEKTWAVFENPANGYRESIPRRAWLWTLLFGAFYLIVRQAWMQLGIWIGLVMLSAIVCAALGIIGAILWFFAAIGIWVYFVANIRNLLAQDYLRRGWREIDLA